MTKRFFIVLGALGAGLVGAACGSPREGFASPAAVTGFSSDGGAVAEPDAGTSCVSATRQAEPVPLAMLVLVDRSGSMAGDKWDAATKAIRAFADRSEVVGMKMGLQFFPPIGTANACTAASYEALAVPIAPLPDNVLPIQQKIAQAVPDGSTPMGPGLAGSIGAMRAFIAKEPMHQGVVILVTDGDPAGCSGDSVGGVAATAAGGVKPVADEPSVRTFAVGMDGASFGSLDQIASAGGGAPKAFNVGAGAAAQQALVDALDEIRAGVLGCEYTLPAPPPSEGVLDLEKVDIEFTAGKNDPPTTIRKVASAAACGATTGGFYYDDPNEPTRVVLCPASCTDVRRGTLEAKVDIVFGCINKPR